MLDSAFCGKCGTRVVDSDDGFCRKCGASLNVLTSQQSAVDQPSAQLSVEHLMPRPPISEWQLSKRPQWPWIVAFVGLLLCVVFGAKAFTAYQVVQRIEASSAVTAAKGLSFVGRLLGASDLGAIVDPRNQALYVEAKQQLVEGVLVAGFGFLVLLVALVVAAGWQPTLEPRGYQSASATDEGRVASWMAYLSAFTLLPVTLLLMAVSGKPDGRSIAAEVALTAGSTAIFVYVYWTLKALLNNTWKFNAVNTEIWALIVLQILTSVQSILLPLPAISTSPSAAEAGTFLFSSMGLGAFLIQVMLMGVLLVILGVKLGKLKGDLYGLLSPFRYVSIALGLCIASVLFLPVALLLAMAQDVLLGMIFSRSRRIVTTDGQISAM